MKQNNVFANLVSKALALAAVVTMSLAFTACSSDNNEEPELKPNTVTIDGRKKPCLKPNTKTRRMGIT